MRDHQLHRVPNARFPFERNRLGTIKERHPTANLQLLLVTHHVKGVALVDDPHVRQLGQLFERSEDQPGWCSQKDRVGRTNLDCVFP